MNDNGGELPPLLRPDAPAPRYHPSFAKKALRASASGFTRRETCRYLEVGEDTLNLWAMIYTEFQSALRSNPYARAERVEDALYRRALGYEVPAEKIMIDKRNDVVREPYLQHIPPDTSAAIAILSVYKPETFGKAAREGGTTVNVVQHTEVNSIESARAAVEGKLGQLAARVRAQELPGGSDGVGAEVPGVGLELLGSP